MEYKPRPRGREHAICSILAGALKPLQMDSCRFAVNIAVARSVVVAGEAVLAPEFLSPSGVAQVGNGNQQFDGSYVNTINAFFQNNHGCNYLLSKKPNLGVLFCHNAFILHKETLSKLSPATPKLLLKVKTNEMIYNTGVCLLHTRSPKMALETFCNAAEAFETSPNFWLRLAECCISHLRKDDEVANERGRDALHCLL